MTLSPEQQNRVLDTALELFEKLDLSEITLDQVTKASGVSAFDIVRHYRSKENILSAVLERELELMSAAAHSPELRMPGETLRDELQFLARIILDEYRRRLSFLGKLVGEALKDQEVGAIFYRTFIMQGRQLFAEFLNARKEVGELREGLDVEAAAAMFLAFLTSIFLLVDLCGGRQVETIDDEDVITKMCDVFLNGVRAR
jgi:AcrR family transcriptional regulator